jgi:hypothetical protein
MGGVSFHPGGYRALVEVELQPKGYAAFLIYTLSDRTSSESVPSIERDGPGCIRPRSNEYGFVTQAFHVTQQPCSDALPL